MSIESFLAMTDFMDAHRLETDPMGNCYFTGIVEYDSPLRKTSAVTGVSFIRNGWKDGEIKLEETNNLFVDEYHLDFNTDFQEYLVDSSTKKLLIKMGIQ